MLLALLVRLPGLYSRSVWFDEAFTLLQTAGSLESVEWPHEPTKAAELKGLFAGRPGTGELARLVRRSDVHPPVYPLALRWWRVLGPSIEVARWFSLLFSLVGVAAFYALLRSAREEGAGVLTGLYSLATGAAHSGHEARAYAFGAAWLGIAALLAFLARSLAGDRARFRASALPCWPASARESAALQRSTAITSPPCPSRSCWLGACSASGLGRGWWPWPDPWPPGSCFSSACRSCWTSTRSGRGCESRAWGSSMKFCS